MRERILGLQIIAAFFVIGGLAGAYLWEQTTARKTLLHYGPATRVIVEQPDIRLTKAQQELFDKWARETKYFGAIAVGRQGPGDREFGSATSGGNSYEVAREVALKRCSKWTPVQCRIYATVIPADYDPDRPELVLSNRITTRFQWIGSFSRDIVLAYSDAGPYAILSSISEDYTPNNKEALKACQENLVATESQQLIFNYPCKIFRGEVVDASTENASRASIWNNITSSAR